MRRDPLLQRLKVMFERVNPLTNVTPFVELCQFFPALTSQEMRPIPAEFTFKVKYSAGCFEFPIKLTSNGEYMCNNDYRCVHTKENVELYVRTGRWVIVNEGGS